MGPPSFAKWLKLADYGSPAGKFVSSQMRTRVHKAHFITDEAIDSYPLFAALSGTLIVLSRLKVKNTIVGT